MNIQHLLIRGSEKVVSHYRLLLASAKAEQERELFISRIERERRLQNAFRGDRAERFAP
ncbi:MAG TPA: hypothetical protein VFL62_11300 [Bradyrhizobium sp.]|uniref:hypothetical protein n=1 Tax=Bradyrhizobium sp. TaxID=376 RepID=UPI002D808123|nr:hypothetical protein [Bradyrhizobium sp.]HET7886803.1 hypothetical protein [Bradyrhizobium sp.]